MSRRRAAQQSGGNKPVASIALNAPSKVNSQETRSQKRKLAGIADNRELNAEQPEQPAKRSRRQTKESGLGSALAPLQNVLKTPTPAPTTRRKMARIPSTAISQASVAMAESRTLEPAMPTTTIKIPCLACRGGPVLIQTDDEDEDNPSSKWLQAQQEFKDAQENDSDSESDMIGLPNACPLGELPFPKPPRAPQLLRKLRDLDLGNVEATPHVELRIASPLPPPTLEDDHPRT
ncbi:hypothetical protein C8J55DRAFT_565415 [Lentinula edodes]|uniref:Uncharacterized protein n=1 Tax=Lentinula lateritia TaxID=40482 RepID=A0A9W9DFM2_9AGAR|nr:hypothetical protein C8J55DRAFT_565415 [Lentinula edodes]